MAIEHDYFGLLESGPDGAVFWSENVDLGDMRVTVDLTAPDQDDITTASLDAAASLVVGLEVLDRRARDFMLKEVDNRASDVTEFLLGLTARYGDELEDYLVDVSGDAAVDVIRSLELASMTILADEFGGKDAFAVLEYAFDDVEADQVIFVNIASTGEIQSASTDE